MNLPVRLRRLRDNAATRKLFQETTVGIGNLLQPYFVVPERDVKREAKKGTALYQASGAPLYEEASVLARAGCGGLMLFGVPSFKRDTPDQLGEQLVPLTDAAKQLKKHTPSLPLFADVCLCSYTTHGHCGLVKDGVIENDASVAALCTMAVELARAGVDFVCPSDMMDGRVAAIRQALDVAGFTRVGIVSYAVKMASAFYGPFRAAADSAPQFGDRTTYQMPAHNRREARREWQLDEAEGADVLLFKPALTNLDLIRDAREGSDLPLFAYQVSGEYAMVRAAADAGLLDFERAITEQLVSIRRAGADVVVSYHARALAGL
ncbi:MAG: porphobilinogen synthase [Myxococcaceae bacterium]|nr:porphobilinogen synthase [Myxococcaceae bacterium]